MEVFYGRTNPNFKTDRPSGLGLGNFDGLHLGHEIDQYVNRI